MEHAQLDEEPVHAPGGGEEQCTTILGGSRDRLLRTAGKLWPHRGRHLP